MKQPPKLEVTPFENRNGVISYRVVGWIHGERVRKNFKTRAEANAEKAALEIGAIQAANGMQMVATSLTIDQVRDAEVCFRRLVGNTRPLSFYLEFALTNYRPPEVLKKLADGISDYTAAKKAELDQDQLSILQYERITSELKRLKDAFPDKLVADMTPPLLIEFLERGKPGMKTYNNRRGILSTFFKFSFHRAWIAENPILKVPHHRIRKRKGCAKTLTVAQCRELMEFFETYEGGRWIPYFALCLFAGIRPGVPIGEIAKLKPDAVKLETGFIIISSQVSKVREPRKIQIQPNLAAWLRAYPLNKLPIVVPNFRKRTLLFRDRFQLTHDVLRHTFISMFVAKFRSVGEAAIQAGNSESIIKSHYLDVRSAEEAEEFFGIMPKHSAAPLASITIHPASRAALRAAMLKAS